MKQDKVKGYKIFHNLFMADGYKFKENKTFNNNWDLNSKSEPKLIFTFYTSVIPYFQRYGFDKDAIVCEVEALGKVSVSAESSIALVTNKIKVNRRLTSDEVYQLINIGEQNRGVGNTGGYNIGNYNTGYKNIGNTNGGSSNIGNNNTGTYNIGEYNSGNENYGVGNIGSSNVGNFNMGTGNNGHHNMGSFNASNNNIGYFNTKTHASYFAMFDRPLRINPNKLSRIPVLNFLLENFSMNIWVFECDMTNEEKSTYPYCNMMGGYLKTSTYKKAWKEFWAIMDDLKKKQIAMLPNFDARIFYKITGIKINDISSIK